MPGAGRATALVGGRAADAASLLTLMCAVLAGVGGCAGGVIWAGGKRLVRCCKGSHISACQLICLIRLVHYYHARMLCPHSTAAYLKSL